MLAFAIVWLGLGLALLSVLLTADEVHLSLLLYLLLHAVAGGGWLILLIRQLVVRSRLERPELNVLNARPHLGETVTFDVRLTAHKPVRVTRVAAVLSCSELVRKARKHEDVLPTVVCRREQTLAENVALKKNEPHDVPGEITIPSEAMQSFESHQYEVRWRLDVLVFVGAHLTWHEREELSVQPVRLAEAEIGT